MRATKKAAKLLLLATCCAALVTPARAQTTQTVLNGGTLSPSVGLLSTDPGAVTNVLTLLGQPQTTGFNFSGTTGSNTSFASQANGSSAGGYFYADYLISVAPGTAESVVTTLTNNSGVQNLSERIYQVSGTGNTFLGDASASSSALQVWSTNYPLPGATVSITAPTFLSTAGLYVIEIRGTTAGNFGGTLSVAAVPEPTSAWLLLAGLVPVLVLVRRQRGKGLDAGSGA